MKEGGMNNLQEEKEKLIRNVKKSVKHLMEESVTKKVDWSVDISLKQGLNLSVVFAERGRAVQQCERCLQLCG